MPAEYYPETGESEGVSTAPEKESDELPAALLPKTMIGGKELQVGDTITMKVTHVYDDEIAVEPVSGPSPEDEMNPSRMMKESPMPVDQEIDRMAQESE